VAGASAAVPNGDEVAAGLLAAEPKGKRMNPIKRQQMEERLHEMEEEIARAESAIAACETELQSFVSAEETQRQTLELANQKSALQSLMAEWEELSGDLETAG
jgi:gas vesicle protein